MTCSNSLNRKLKSVLFILALACFCHSVSAETESRQDLNQIQLKIKDFLRIESTGSPGTVGISVSPPDPRLNLPACNSLEAAFPPGSRAWGKTTVEVRCSSPAIWRIFVEARVSITAAYLVAALPLAQGHEITENDVQFQKGDLTTLPPGIYTSLTHVLGHTVALSLPAGSILRQEMIKAPNVIQRGQSVNVLSIGKNFEIGYEGIALGDAVENQMVQVKVSNGRIVQGFARKGGVVEVRNRGIDSAH